VSGATADTRMHRPEAVEIARAFVAEIEPYADQLVVAGSLRRRLAWIGDIEVVCVPKVEIEQIETVGLFGSEFERRDVDRLDAHLTMLLEAGTVTKRLDAAGSPRWGKKLKYLTYRGAPVDLFAPEAGQFGWHLLLRTGPAAFSRQLVVPTVDDKGRPGRTKDRRRGLMPSNLISEGGWLRYRMSREPIPTPTEQSVFELFKIPYIEPSERM
jgi:DNA polymerase/3'-5' exonuclease PolX